MARSCRRRARTTWGCRRVRDARIASAGAHRPTATPQRCTLAPAANAPASSSSRSCAHIGHHRRGGAAAGRVRGSWAMVRRSASSPVILFDCQRWATIEFTGIVEEEKSVHVSRNVGRIDGHDRPTPFYSSSLVTVGEGATRPPQLRRLRDVRTRLHSVCGAVGDSDRGKMSTILRFGEAFRVLSVRAVFLCFWYPRSLCSIIICAPRCI